MSLPGIEHIEKDGFRLRGLEMSRIDGFSDVVFGFALTLLVVSLEIPKTYAELHESLSGFLPFAICFLFLMMVWYGHYKFFRRFGLHDFPTIVINAMLLFVILFYVYPLKFLFTFVVDIMLGHPINSFETNAQVAQLMAIYGIGFTAVYTLFAALYINAWRQRVALELNALELVLLKGYLLDVGGVASIGLLATFLAETVQARKVGLTGFSYMLIAVVNWITGSYTRRQVSRLKKTHKPHHAKV